MAKGELRFFLSLQKQTKQTSSALSEMQWLPLLLALLHR